MSTRPPCPDCSGKGSTSIPDTRRRRDCPTCRGSGRADRRGRLSDALSDALPVIDPRNAPRGSP